MPRRFDITYVVASCLSCTLSHNLYIRAGIKYVVTAFDMYFFWHHDRDQTVFFGR